MATNNLAEQSQQLNGDSMSASPKVLGIDLTVHKRHNSTRVRDVEAETSAIGTDVDLSYLLEENARQMLKYRKRPRLDHEKTVKLSNSFFNQDFPTRLWKIVDSDLFKSATWDKNGIYMLLDEERFTKEVLQRTGFQPTLPCVTMAGFDQQLILYGFQKLSSATPTSKLSMYYHHSFRQHQENLLKKIKVVAELEAVEEDDVEIVMVIPGPPRQPDPPVTPISPPVTSKAETRDGQAEKDEKKEKEQLSLAAKDLVAKISSAVNQNKTVLLVTPSSSHTPSTPTPAPASSPAPSFTLSYPTSAPSCSYSNPSTPAQALTPYYTYSTPAPTTAPASSSPNPPTASVAGASSQTSRPTTTHEGHSGSSRSITPIGHGWVRLNPNPFDRAPGPAGPAPGPPVATSDACPYHLAHSLVFTPSINHQLCIAKAQFEEANEAQALQAHQSQAQARNAHLAQAQSHQAQAQQVQAQALNAHQAQVHQAQSQQVQAQALYAQMAQAQMAWMQAAMYNPWVLQAMQMQMAAYMSSPPHYLHRPAGGFSTTHHINPVFPSGSSSPARAGSESGRYSPDPSFSPPNLRTPLSLHSLIHPSKPNLE
ncbi:COPII coat assembly protein sec16-like [Oncorhynchus mykiss]|uniref:HSF-type DNA-binding domain-containing protein n=1 Tax=Oncorhynchus mykiss TaxID=8022 RepID=A0A8C7TW43_ONCMY|nr:COPII coat assembly protein sec16-like [Oncorhynchus mykiss]